MSQGDRDLFYVRVVGVATTFGRAVAALKGVLARGEEDGGVGGEEITGVGPERPVDTTIRAEWARYGYNDFRTLQLSYISILGIGPRGD